MSKKSNFSFDYRKIVAECFGCFVLTFFGCGTAVGTGDAAAIAVVFGFVIISMAYSIGPISGCHINPGVSLTMLLMGRLSIVDFILYAISQFVGAIIAGFLLLAIAGNSRNLWDKNLEPRLLSGLGENGFTAGLDEPYEGSQHINLGGAILIEIIMAFVFYTVIVINTRKNSPTGNLAGIVIGVTLTICIATGLGFTGCSVNPARSFGPALALVAGKQYVGIKQWWVFLVSSISAAIITALFCRFVLRTESDGSESEDSAAPVADVSPSAKQAVPVPVASSSSSSSPASSSPASSAAARPVEDLSSSKELDNSKGYQYQQPPGQPEEYLEQMEEDVGEV